MKCRNCGKGWHSQFWERDFCTLRCFREKRAREEAASYVEITFLPPGSVSLRIDGKEVDWRKAELREVTEHELAEMAEKGRML